MWLAVSILRPSFLLFVPKSASPSLQRDIDVKGNRPRNKSKVRKLCGQYSLLTQYFAENPVKFKESTRPNPAKQATKIKGSMRVFI